MPGNFPVKMRLISWPFDINVARGSEYARFLYCRPMQVPRNLFMKISRGQMLLARLRSRNQSFGRLVMRGLIAASWPGVVLDFAHSSSLEDRLFLFI